MKSRTALLKTRRLLLALGLICLIGVRCGGKRSEEKADSYWTVDKIDLFNKKYGLHDKGYHYHYPRKSFLRYGYYPPGG